LISRNDHPFASFAELAKRIAEHLPANTVIDGEIVAVDRRGKPRFNDLMFHRRPPCFFAFALLTLDGKATFRYPRRDNPGARSLSTPTRSGDCSPIVRSPPNRGHRHNGIHGTLAPVWTRSQCRRLAQGPFRPSLIYVCPLSRCEPQGSAVAGSRHVHVIHKNAWSNAGPKFTLGRERIKPFSAHDISASHRGETSRRGENVARPATVRLRPNPGQRKR
jgi:hypothetical protein